MAFNILLVDDTPENLTAFESVLAALDGGGDARLAARSPP